jgi:hypothetical protein
VRDLNFFPYFEQLLISREKTTTIRLGEAEYEPGEIVRLTIGWSEPGERLIHEAKITNVYKRALRNLVKEDLEGESPDCQSLEVVSFVIGCIYRTVLSGDDIVTVVKFRYVD